MKYVNKSYERVANPIIDQYIAFAQKQPWYCAKELYAGFWGRRGKHKLIDEVLLPEQSNKCCYCQKCLVDHSDSDVTVEHIIRQSVPNAASMQRYFKPQYLGLNSINVCHTDDFILGNMHRKSYPHKVAYHNFAIACKRCNNARRHQDLDIPFLYPLIESEVIYNRSTGKVVWKNDPFVPSLTERYTLDKLDLNTPLLKAIRAIWMFGKKYPTATYSTPDTARTLYQRRNLIYRAMAESAAHNQWFSLEDQDAFISLLTDYFWDELLKFDYFATI